MDDLERSEFDRKLERLRAYLRDHGYAAALLGRQDDFAWITSGGDNRVLRTVENGVGILAITPDRVWLVAHTMDAARVHDDELAGTSVEVVAVKWHECSPEEKALALCGRGRVLSDVAVAGAELAPSAFARLQHPLSKLEVARCRELGARTDAILRRVADGLSPDRTEADVAAELVASYEREGMTVDVCLVGGRERIPGIVTRSPLASPLARWCSSTPRSGGAGCTPT